MPPIPPALELLTFVARSPNRVEALGTRRGGPATVAEVQERTGIPRATLSRILADPDVGLPPIWFARADPPG